MTPSLSLPTDSVYKFCCLFGLSLVIVGSVSFLSVYNASLAEKIKRTEDLIALQAKPQKAPEDEQRIKLYERVLKLVAENEKAGYYAVSAMVGLGLAASLLGGIAWYQKVQLRDDRIGQLQLERLELEVANLRSESGAASTAPDPTTAAARTQSSASGSTAPSA
jgi:hypothetical protein